MEWWIWILIGLVLVLAEVVTPGGFYFIFFGAGAVSVGILAGLQLAGPVWLQFILFSVLSIGALWLFREKLLHLTQTTPREPIDNLIGETAVAVNEILINAVGKAELRGASWSARNVGDQPLARGERCKVEKVEGLMIFVRREQV